MAVSLEDLDRGGLAGTVRAEHREDLARLDLEVQTVDRARFAVVLAQTADDDGCPGHRPGSDSPSSPWIRATPSTRSASPSA